MQILSGLILLAVLIVFHELGHFLVAKLMGVQVLTFSLGFGPKLVSFKHKETEYRIAAIPLGGYVRMFGESLEEELTSDEKKISFMHQPIWRKSLIALAGPVFNFILPVFLFFILLLGTENYYAPKVGTLLPGGAAERAGFLPDDEIKSINNQAFESFTSVAEKISESPDMQLDVLVTRKNIDGQTQDIKLTVIPEAKSEPNALDKDRIVGRIGIMPARQKPMVWLSNQSPMLKLGLSDLDEIKKIDNLEISSAQFLQVSIQKIKLGSKIIFSRLEQELSLTVSSEELVHLEPQEPVISYDLGDSPVPTKIIDQSRELVLAERASAQTNLGLYSAQGVITKLLDNSYAKSLGLVLGDKIISMNGEVLASMLQVQQSLLNQTADVQVLSVLSKDLTPKIFVFKLPKEILENINLNSNLLNTFGIETAQVFSDGELRAREVGGLEAFSRAISQTMSIAALTAKSIWLLIKGDVPVSQIGGPIMLFDVAQQAAQKGMAYYIYIMCLLSVNLGLLNLLPVPALDGGHLLLFGIEAIQRKPLSQKTRGLATQIGVTLVLFLMGLAIFNDLSRIFR